MGKKIYGSFPEAELTNIVVEGYMCPFSSDNWTDSSSVYTIGNGSNGYTRITMKANHSSATGTYPVVQTFSNAISGTGANKKIIYMQAKVRGLTSNVGYPRVYYTYNSSNYSNLTSIDGLSGTALNDANWHTLSMLAQTESASGTSFSISAISFGIQPGTTKNDSMDVKDIMVVDLTSAFGAGNEPSKSWCDTNLSFFDGTKSIPRYLTLRNIVPDSDMEDSSWTGGNYSTTEKLFGTRSQYFPAGATTVQTIATTTLPIVGHKYYGRHYLKTNGNANPADCRFEWYAGDGPGLNYVFGWNQGNYPNWTMESSIVTVDAVNGSSYSIRSFAVDANVDIWADGLMVIDLTATFGAGNEPSKEWCDENISYFDGTTDFKGNYNKVALSDKAFPLRKGYVGIDGVARKIKKGYIGVGNVARKFYEAMYFSWREYSLDYEEVIGSDTTSISGFNASSTFYFGSSYTFDPTTGEFTVNQTTARRAITNPPSAGEYFVRASTSSGPQTGPIVYRIVTPMLTAGYCYCRPISANQTAKGTYIKDVFSTDPTDYPDDGIQGDCYYVSSTGGVYTYTGNCTVHLYTKGSNYYKLLELTSSGVLTFEDPTTCDIWFCGAGGSGKGGGGNAGYAGHGGGGAYAQSLDNIRTSSVVVTIGAASGGNTTVNVSPLTLLTTNLGTYTKVSGTYSATAHETYFQSIVGKGVTGSQTSENYYSNSTTPVYFTYAMNFNVPSGATITRVYCEVNGHAEDASNSNEYMCVQLKSGSTNLSSEVNFKSTGTSNTTITLEATTIPTVAQLQSMVLYCKLGQYGGAINGATCYVSYSIGGNVVAYGGNKNPQGTAVQSQGGSGGGKGGSNTASTHTGDGLSKYPFNDRTYFHFPYCDGGGGGGSAHWNSSGTSSHRQGGVGGTNGSDGTQPNIASSSGGAGGGHYGGTGGDGNPSSTTSINGSNATGYGSAGGGGGNYDDDEDKDRDSGSGGSGYQGVCFVRILLN